MKINLLNKTQRGCFKQTPLAVAVLLALATPFASNLAHANGGGFGANTDISGGTIDVQTYYANSPQGVRPAYDFGTHTLSTTKTINTGTPIRKFVDKLGGVYNGLENLPGMTDLQSGIPVAIKEKWFNPITGQQTGDDYYEIAIVEYSQRMHSDLPKGTTLRGYVQIETPAIAAGLKDVTGLIGSEHIAATYPDHTPITDPSKVTALNPTGQVYFVHKPHFLGPVILASKGTAVRMKYTNFLPYTTATGVKVGSPHGGELQIPVDKSIAGGGPILDVNGHETGREFSQNRASIHWHGGDTPWISDGTPHQWIAPAGDVAWSLGTDGAHIGKGVSQRNVPDMPDPGQGSGTLYFPNNMSGRMMFYHDHTSGLTRLNVYMGEAAGYVITDEVELKLVADAIGTTLDKKLTSGAYTGLPVGTLDAVGIPLVIQDRIYVPNNIGPIGGTVTINGVTSVVEQSQDAKWDLNHWGQPGDLWYPHVYETNQDPNSLDGTNPTGRWDWGPWFWPVFPAQFSLPTGNFGDVTLTPEAFMDTATVNGQAYPSLDVEPKTYRFRILNAANDRTQNLSLFQAVDASGQVCDASTPAGAAAITKAASMAGQADLAACTEVRMVPAVPTAGFPATWPTDGRAGGTPDPLTAGPDIVQIGSEGGLLPALTILKPQPVTFDLDKRSITILNVLNSGLLLGGGERADVLIDFSKYAGKTLILYNDAPTPMPAVDPRTDYFTGMGDMTDAGGAYDPLEGYGPNTRTVMQIKVAAATSTGIPAAPLDTAALANALTVAYAKTQPAPHIPQMVYNPAFGTDNVDNYAKIFTGGLTEPYFQMQGTTFAITGATVVSGGSGYDAALPPAVTFTAPPAGGKIATAKAVVQGGVVTGFSDFFAGSGYTNTVPLTVKIAPPGNGGTTATAKVEVNALKVINKAIQELFDPIYGRMNATLAVELPFTSQAVATTIPLAYIDAPIESLDGISDGETQIWKITHNGVDSHPVHFHLMNVQLINRVDWAGVIKPPHPGEMGWKETITMNPLEDVYVAAKAMRPAVPFGLPTSRRLLDPSQAVGSTVFFTNIDPVTGQTPTFQRQLVDGVNTDVTTAAYSNQLTDFDNEYVWHCHILGHEENDFMRPMIFHPNVVLPDVPGKVEFASNQVTWTDPTPVGGYDKNGVPTAGASAQNMTANPIVANGVTYPVGAIYPVEPTNNPKNEIGFKVFRTVTTTVTTTTPAPVGAVDPAPTVTKVSTSAPATVALVEANATRWTDTQPPVLASSSNTDAAGVTVASVDSVVYDVVAYNATGDSKSGTSIVQVAPEAAPALPTTKLPTASVTAPTGVTQTYTPNVGTVLSWDAVAGATGYVVTIGGVAQTVTGNTLTLGGAPTGQIITVAAQVATATGTATGAASSVFNGIAYAPVALTVSNPKLATVPTGTVTLTWANSPLNLGNVTGLTLSWTAKGNNQPVLGTRALPATNTGATVIGLQSDKEFTFSVVANSALGDSAVTKATALSGK